MATSDSSIDEFLMHFLLVGEQVHADVIGLESVAHLSVFLPSCRPLHDDRHGGFHYKQCFDHYCWCVDENGDPRNGTVTSQSEMLTCTKTGAKIDSY